CARRNPSRRGAKSFSIADRSLGVQPRVLKRNQSRGPRRCKDRAALATRFVTHPRYNVPLGRPTVVESLPCLWEVKKLAPLEAILAASSPIFSKGLAAATFRLTVSRPMSAPGHGFWPGRRPRASIRGAFLFLLPWKPIGSWETGRMLRASNRFG